MAHALFHQLIHHAFNDLDAARKLVNEHPEVLQMRHGIGETALHWLAVENQAEAVSLLIELGAKVRVGTRFGRNALEEAVSVNAMESAAVLKNAGARLPTPPRPPAPPRVFRTSEQQFVQLIQDRWPQGALPSDDVIDLCRRAIRQYERSAALWRMYLDLLHLRFGGTENTLIDALAAYRRADWLPVDATAWCEFGYFMRDLIGRHEEAGIAFRNAIAQGGAPESYVDLARVLAEQGRHDDARRLLAPDKCPFADHPTIKAVRDGLENSGADAT